MLKTPSSTSSDDLIAAWTLISAGAAAATVIGLAWMQSDHFGRWWLSAPRLLLKRQAEYQYRWKHALEKALIQVKYAWAGGMAEYDADAELIHTTILTRRDRVEAFVAELISELRNPKRAGTQKPLRIGPIAQDPRIPGQEYYVWLFRDEGGEKNSIYQVPLTLLSEVLVAALENEVNTQTFCFVVDASAQAGSSLVVNLIAASKLPVFMVESPLWMACLASLATQRIYPQRKLEQLLWSLCRLEGMRSCNPEEKTVLITIPGQAVASVLLNLLQAAFPDDRHVFCYTDCARAVNSAHKRRCSYPRARIPGTVAQALSIQDPVCVTTPLDVHRLIRSTNVREDLGSALAMLPLYAADTAESWMGLIDTFYVLKSREEETGYMPYVLNFDYLLPSTSAGGAIEIGSPRYWSLLSLLQFITGSRSRKLSSQAMDAALGCLSEQLSSMRFREKIVSTPAQVLAINRVVSRHALLKVDGGEGIVLPDTVQPTQHWSLKADSPTARGCSCCVSTPNSSYEDQAMSGISTLQDSVQDKSDLMNLPGAFATALRRTG